MFTWTNNKKFPNQILERLDRFVANDSWRTCYPNYLSSNLDYFGSDHCPVLINLNPIPLPSYLPPEQNPFSFEHKWLQEDDYENFVKHCWEDPLNPSDLNLKLKNLSLELRCWAKERVGSITKKIKDTKAKINKCMKGPNTGQIALELNRLSVILEKLTYKEEIHWQQRSRNNWLATGDHNTTFFHKTAPARRRRNCIISQRRSWSFLFFPIRF